MPRPVPLAHEERQRLCDLFEDLGPDAPTLNEGWTNADLAAHLYVREHRPDANPGLVVPALHGWTARVEAKARERLEFGATVRRLRQGPPPWSPFGIPGLADRVDLHEWFVHHEDVRRANGMGPREDGPDLQRLDDGIWRLMPTWGPRLARRITAEVWLVSDDGRRRRIRNAKADGGGDLKVEVHGRPTELFLRLFGRSVAATEAIGGPAGLAAWEAGPFGL